MGGSIDNKIKFIDKKNIDIKILDFTNFFEKHGAEVYFVGGVIRDMIINNWKFPKTKADYDIEIYNLTSREIELLLDKYGLKYNYFEKFGNFKIYSLNIEMTLPREEISTGQGYNDFEISINPYLDKKKAGIRRDFTMNTILMRINTGEIIDNFSGIYAIENKEIKHLSSKFVEDPFRVLRGVRFSSELGFEINFSTLNLMKQMSYNLEYIKINKIEKEIDKFFLGNFLKIGLDNFYKILFQYLYFNKLEYKNNNDEYLACWKQMTKNIIEISKKKKYFQKKIT